MKRIARQCLAAVAFMATGALLCAPVRAADVLVFAASSTTTALNAVNAHYKRIGGGDVAATYGSSGAFARQIASGGAPANIVISAHPKWTHFMSIRRVIHPRDIKGLLANRLALVAPKDSAVELDIKTGFPLRSALGDGRLALGDPRHVPAGDYAMNAMKSLRVWKDVEARTVRTRDVRAALALVERGEAVLGVVYATDAAISKRVRTVGLIPENMHHPIRYDAAIVATNRTPAAKRYFTFLWSEAAQSIFRHHGFDVDWWK